jgi:hypothetical protein
MVRQGAPVVLHELESAPVVATYQFVDARAEATFDPISENVRERHMIR